MKYLCLLLFTGLCIRSFAQCNTAFIISRGKTASASSQESASYAPGYAFDGNRTTRWASLATDDQYLSVDLGEAKQLCQVDLIWEKAFGKNFTIDLSSNNTTWTTVATITGNTSLKNTIYITGAGRYVRMHGTSRGTGNGYSLYGMHVFGTEISTSCPSTNLALGMPAAASSTEGSAFPPSQAFDGSTTTRWASKYLDTASIQVDLGATYAVCRITLQWETAYGVDFTIDGSQDSVTWRNLATVTGNTSRSNIFTVNGVARFVRMRGTKRATQYGYSLYEFSVSGGIIASGSVLPVKLEQFNVYLTGNKYVELKWVTASERSNDHFEIERSHDGKTFEAIGTVKGGNNSDNALSYEWVDYAPYPGVSYYRLKQVDIDGQSDYSRSISIHLNDSEHDVMVYPNPVIENVAVRAASGDRILAVQVFNAAGVEVADHPVVSGTYLSIPMTTFTRGIYIIRVDVEKGGRQFFKVVKE